MPAINLGLLLKDYAIISVGLIVYVFGWVAFIIPNGIVGGGVGGIGVLIYYATGFSISYSYLLANIFLLIAGIKILGKDFGAKTVFCILFCTLLFEVLPLFIPVSLIKQVTEEPNLLLWVLVGGAFEGIGMGLVFTRGGNTGGTDIIALIVNHFRHINPGRVLLYCDIIIIGSSILLPERTILSLLYGGIMVTVSTYVIDAILVGSKQSMQVMLFSTKYKEIGARIEQELGRGMTVLRADGWFSQAERNVLLLIIRKYEINAVYRIINEIDKGAFISTTSATGVFGEGFDPIKSGSLKLRKKTPSA
ncbi:MAG: YitT family protein [Bacteroidales bacterium]